ncbi:hypothetical protein ACFL5U_03990 [Candidatus Margulisiibacteriota bacterium]
MFRRAMHLTHGNKSRAEDLVQTVFTDFVAQQGRYPDNNPVAPLLNRMLWCRAIDSQRLSRNQRERLSRREGRSEREELILFEKRSHASDSNALSPFAETARQNLREQVREALGFLSQREANVLLMHLEASGKDVGSAHAITESRVSQLITESSPRLRNFLSRLESVGRREALRHARKELEFVLSHFGWEYGDRISLHYENEETGEPSIRFERFFGDRLKRENPRGLVRAYFKIVRDVGLERLSTPDSLAHCHHRRVRLRKAIRKAESQLTGTHPLAVRDIVREYGIKQSAFNSAARADPGFRRMLGGAVMKSRIQWRRSRVAKAVEKVQREHSIPKGTLPPIHLIWKELEITDVAFLAWRREDQDLLPEGLVPCQSGDKRRELAITKMEEFLAALQNGQRPKPKNISDLARQIGTTKDPITKRTICQWSRDIPRAKELIRMIFAYNPSTDVLPARLHKLARYPKEERHRLVREAVAFFIARGDNFATHPIRITDLVEKIGEQGIGFKTFQCWIVEDPTVIPDDAIILFTKWKAHPEFVHEHRQRRVRLGLQQARAAGVHHIGAGTFAEKWLNSSDQVPRRWISEDPTLLKIFQKYSDVISEESLELLQDYAGSAGNATNQSPPIAD